ncbi:putative 2-aminoethylphosphonate ABC transporter permease subunit [Humitalea sp. 24SJ18S-53]|uniref:putative 2-aminoethylphosphonate ABC transporter permease subunit n=1 Tax=Humitalea sp. 24SJ18S-53 TaxID=3422307 RepID=UPI003D67A30C
MPEGGSAIVLSPSARGAPVVRSLAPDQRLMRWTLALAGVAMVVVLAAPMAMLLVRAFQDADGAWVGLANFTVYVTTPTLAVSAWNSLWTAAVATVVVVPLAFVYAYGLTRSRMPGRGAFRAVMMVPVLAPSLLPALALITLFGNQGLLKAWLFGGTIYGPVGIVVAQVFACFPHAAIILAVALATADGRLYEAAEVLRAGRVRTFLTVTLPGAGYGLVSASVVVFTMVVTDFGIPKVIGGSFNVLATDVYKQVVGQQNFNMGAVVGIVLLVPALVAFALERWATRRRAATMTGRAVAYVPKARLWRDLPLLLACLGIAGLLLAVVGTAFWSSLIRFWPWNLALTWDNYDFGRFDTAGWGSVWTSVKMAAWAAAVGTPVIFVIAWLVARTPQAGFLRGAVGLLVTAPLAIPGLVLGLAYILFFNHPANPLNVLYGTLAILALNSVVHFWTVGHLTATTALRQLDPEFEAASASLKVPVWTTFGRVTVPMCLPAVLEISAYIFVNAMTTVSAVIFLYGPDFKPAAVAAVQMDEAGQSSAAAAMACVILAVALSVKIAQVGVSAVIDRTTQGWRRR